MFRVNIGGLAGGLIIRPRGRSEMLTRSMALPSRPCREDSYEQQRRALWALAFVLPVAESVARRECAMTETRDRVREPVPGPQARPSVWQQDYSICTCDRSWDECPHCGQGGSDTHHRGQCHARLCS